jgi:LytS/YehU family sensor histidine kinase
MTGPAKASPNIARGVLGAILGALAGLPLGLVFYAVARAFFLSSDLWSSDAIMLAIIGTTAAATAYFAGSHGARPTRGGKIAVHSITGFLIGALVTGPLVGALVGIIGGIMGVSQREGAFAMGIAFTIVPLAGLLGGIALAIFMGRRAAKRGIGAGSAS